MLLTLALQLFSNLENSSNPRVANVNSVGNDTQNFPPSSQADYAQNQCSYCSIRLLTYTWIAARQFEQMKSGGNQD